MKLSSTEERGLIDGLLARFEERAAAWFDLRRVTRTHDRRYQQLVADLHALREAHAATEEEDA